tara:strand:+ start:2052 stop:2510 length:459 start_codon:yes stop_codon:yes gene_type:complete
MGVITPTLTLTANASTATTDAGPMSIALSLSATDSLPVTEVQSKIIDVSTTHGLLWDASAFTASGTVGADGAWLYFKNTLAENTSPDLLHDIIISHTNADADNAADAHRLFTLQPGEFAWFPWDCTQDIYVDAMETNAAALECWIFVRTGTA